ncbi:unnamed protein product, partial [Amoebophrya sp. A120]
SPNAEYFSSSCATRPVKGATQAPPPAGGGAASEPRQKTASCSKLLKPHSVTSPSSATNKMTGASSATRNSVYRVGDRILLNDNGNLFTSGSMCSSGVAATRTAKLAMSPDDRRGTKMLKTTGGQNAANSSQSQQSPKQEGIVRYRGLTSFAPGIWLGIELLNSCAEGKRTSKTSSSSSLKTPQQLGSSNRQTTLGKHDGCVNSIRYFQCPPNCGLFVRESKILLNSSSSSSLLHSNNTNSSSMDSTAGSVNSSVGSSCVEGIPGAPSSSTEKRSTAMKQRTNEKDLHLKAGSKGRTSKRADDYATTSTSFSSKMKRSNVAQTAKPENGPGTTTLVGTGRGREDDPQATPAGFHGKQDEQQYQALARTNRGSGNRGKNTSTTLRTFLTVPTVAPSSSTKQLLTARNPNPGPPRLRVVSTTGGGGASASPDGGPPGRGSISTRPPPAGSSTTGCTPSTQHMIGAEGGARSNPTPLVRPNSTRLRSGRKDEYNTRENLLAEGPSTMNFDKSSSTSHRKFLVSRNTSSKMLLSKKVSKNSPDFVLFENIVLEDAPASASSCSTVVNERSCAAGPGGGERREGPQEGLLSTSAWKTAADHRERTDEMATHVVPGEEAGNGSGAINSVFTTEKRPDKGENPSEPTSAPSSYLLCNYYSYETPQKFQREPEKCNLNAGEMTRGLDEVEDRQREPGKNPSTHHEKTSLYRD